MALRKRFLYAPQRKPSLYDEADAGLGVLSAPSAKASNLATWSATFPIPSTLSVRKRLFGVAMRLLCLDIPLRDTLKFRPGASAPALVRSGRLSSLLANCSSNSATRLSSSALSRAANESFSSLSRRRFVSSWVSSIMRPSSEVLLASLALSCVWSCAICSSLRFVSSTSSALALRNACNSSLRASKEALDACSSSSASLRSVSSDVTLSCSSLSWAWEDFRPSTTSFCSSATRASSARFLSLLAVSCASSSSIRSLLRFAFSTSAAPASRDSRSSSFAASKADLAACSSSWEVFSPSTSVCSSLTRLSSTRFTSLLPLSCTRSSSRSFLLFFASSASTALALRSPSSSSFWLSM
mmetsp:Transcript_19275/g.58294  ORF Transcript_19275/g.58294 Transcript_19275/m.58294 type:complete len:355 (+) Transcript_19275:35-1099(+)